MTAWKAVRQVGLRLAQPVAKAADEIFRSLTVIGIASIAIFLAVIVALNWYEFGRID